jgi:heterotetrameric sarcosine oxidase gamma subunit
MAGPDALMPLRRDAIGHWAASLMGDPDASSVVIRSLEPLHVLALRHLPGGAQAIAQALRPLGIDTLPVAARLASSAAGAAGPCVLWRSPSEWNLVSTDPNHAQLVEQALRATALDGQACSVNLSDGIMGLDLHGPQVDALLKRLLDAASLPREAGQATRVRLVDVPVTLVRFGEHHLWLLADCSHDHYIAAWLAHACAAAGLPT